MFSLVSKAETKEYYTHNFISVSVRLQLSASKKRLFVDMFL